MIVMTGHPIHIIAVIFMCGIGLVWVAGTRLAHLGDMLAERSGLKEEFVGLIFPATVTERPDPSADEGSIPHEETCCSGLLRRWRASQTIVYCLLIVVAGVALAVSADRLAGKTAIGTSFIAVTVLAAAASFPGPSAPVAAARSARLHHGNGQHGR